MSFGIFSALRGSGNFHPNSRFRLWGTEKPHSLCVCALPCFFLFDLESGQPALCCPPFGPEVKLCPSHLPSREIPITANIAWVLWMYQNMCGHEEAAHKISLDLFPSSFALVVSNHIFCPFQTCIYHIGPSSPIQILENIIQSLLPYRALPKLHAFLSSLPCWEINISVYVYAYAHMFPRDKVKNFHCIFKTGPWSKMGKKDFHRGNVWKPHSTDKKDEWYNTQEALVRLEYLSFLCTLEAAKL